MGIYFATEQTDYGLNIWAGKGGTYMVLVLQFGRLDLLELLRQGRHDGQIDQQAVEKS